MSSSGTLWVQVGRTLGEQYLGARLSMTQYSSSHFVVLLVGISP